MSFHLRNVCPLAVLLLLALDGAIIAQVDPSSIEPQVGCERRELSGTTLWVFSTSMEPGGESLLLVDPLLNTVLRYDLQTGQLQPATRPTDDALPAPFLPVAVGTAPTGTLVETATGELVILPQASLESEFHPISLRWRGRVPGSISVEALWTWAPAGDQLISCSDLLYGSPRDGSWTRGLVRIPLGGSGEFQLLDQSSVDDPRWTYCRAGLRIVTSLGDRAFVLLIGEEGPGIYAHEPGWERLRRLPKVPSELVQMPSLPDYSNLDEFTFLSAIIESSTMAYGLYASEGYLYLLHRQAGEGPTTWTLAKLDPRDGELLGTMTLPSTADHLLAVPGSETWAFLEKGSLSELGHQGVQSVFTLPGSGIRALRGHTEVRTCRSSLPPLAPRLIVGPGLELALPAAPRQCGPLSRCKTDPGEQTVTKTFDAATIRCSGSQGGCSGGGFEY